VSFIDGEARDQMSLLPACIDDYVAIDALVRVVDAFVDSLDLAELGFSRVIGDRRASRSWRDHSGRTTHSPRPSRLAAHQPHWRLLLGTGESHRDIYIPAAPASGCAGACCVTFLFCPLTVYSCPFYGVTPSCRITRTSSAPGKRVQSGTSLSRI
jgi:hypothetical protein